MQTDFNRHYYGSWAKKALFLEETTSTNKVLLDNNFAPGDIASAVFQTAGRGRTGRSWQSAHGDSLMFSVVLPEIKTDKLMGAQIVAAYAASAALAPYAPVRVKWPNDLVIDGKKLGGLLIETRFSGSRLEKAVLGIGINIKKAPEGLEAAFLDAYCTPPPGGRLLAEILGELERFYTAYLSGALAIEPLWENYSANSGKEVSFHLGGKKVKGRELGIDSYGRLIAEYEGERRIITEVDAGHDFNL